MEIFQNPLRNQWAELCLRPSDRNPMVESRVKAILERVKNEGDAAIKALSLEIDKCELASLRVTDSEMEEACAAVSQEVKDAVSRAKENIAMFHSAQIPKLLECNTAPGVRCIQKPVPVQSVGLYIPGGTAPLFSTVLMLAVPAKLAGCPRIVLCTPASREGRVAPEVLYTARVCGIDEIYKIGGAQAVAAMAYGTESIRKVDKIFGPGNQYVTTAKQIVSTENVAIDMPAGPSEVMVIADSEANASYVAADLLSQAEHGPDSQVMLLCESLSFVAEVKLEIEKQCNALPRSETAWKALDKSRAVVFDSDADIADFANEYAAEHLIINRKDAWEICGKICNAGSIFVGPCTPESAGDYASGTNHTLPTCGWSRSYSGVNMDSFFKKITIQEITREGLEALSSTILNMAEAEGLQAHANAVRVRLGK